MQSLWETIEGVFPKLSVNAVLGQCGSGAYISEGAIEVCTIEVVNFVIIAVSTSYNLCARTQVFLQVIMLVMEQHLLLVWTLTAPAPSVNINGDKLNNQLTPGLPLELHSHK